MTEPQSLPGDQPEQPQVQVSEVDTAPDNEPTATTAGEEDHNDPDALRGDDADAPADTGVPPQED